MRRRAFLTAAAATPFLGFSLAGRADTLRSALTESDLIYLSPLKSNGDLSRCQAEVWYVMQGADALVCTSADSWRATAPAAGLTRTRLWAADEGVWRNGRYRTLPSAMVDASIESDTGEIETALSLFGDKYAAEWGTWGPRFRRGLADGSRVMLRYKLS
jgi:hypothetical protein